MALFIGTVGAVSVFKAVYIDKRDIKCACVGGSSKVPLGFVSLTENVMMVAMAVWMLAVHIEPTGAGPVLLPRPRPRAAPCRGRGGGGLSVGRRRDAAGLVTGFHVLGSAALDDFVPGRCDSILSPSWRAGPTTRRSTGSPSCMEGCRRAGGRRSTRHLRRRAGSIELEAEGPSVREGRFETQSRHRRRPVDGLAFAEHALTLRGQAPAWRDVPEVDAWAVGAFDALREAADAMEVDEAVLAACRLHYLLALRRIPSKSEAGLYGLIAFEERWRRIVDEALRIRREPARRPCTRTVTNAAETRSPSSGRQRRTRSPWTKYTPGFGGASERLSWLSQHGPEMSEPDDRHGGVAVDHTRQIARLRRIEGQVRGLQQMIENGRYCVDVAHQADAVIAALRRVQSDMLRDHMQALVQAALTGKPARGGAPAARRRDKPPHRQGRLSNYCIRVRSATVGGRRRAYRGCRAVAPCSRALKKIPIGG